LTVQDKRAVNTVNPAFVLKTDRASWRWFRRRPRGLQQGPFAVDSLLGLDVQKWKASVQRKLTWNTSVEAKRRPA
jgi:hypothetical protein